MHIRTNILTWYDKSIGTDDMHDYSNQLLVINFTLAKHCKDTLTAAVVSKGTCTNNVYITSPVGWEGTFPTVGVSNYKCISGWQLPDTDPG